MMITAKQLTLKTPNGRTLLKGLNFSLKSGETLFIRGPNGIGKSTLLRACLGETDVIDGQLVRSIALKDVAFLPQLQNTELHLPFTLQEVLLTELRRTNIEQCQDLGGLLSTEALARAWNNASGGERQKTLLLRAVLQRKKLLILDEPMNHLDSLARRQAAATLSAYTDAGDKSLIIVSHEPDSAAYFPNARVLDLTEFLA